jgi:hypothetical protein
MGGAHGLSLYFDQMWKSSINLIAMAHPKEDDSSIFDIEDG